MADRHQLSVTLPDDLADQVRAKVESGRFASESDVVIEALRTLEDRERCVEQWLRTEVVEAYDALAADPSRGLSLDEVRSSLAATHDRLAADARERLAVSSSLQRRKRSSTASTNISPAKLRWTSPPATSTPSWPESPAWSISRIAARRAATYDPACARSRSAAG